MRVHDLEFRRIGQDRPAEIVQWRKKRVEDAEYCCTILWYQRDSEGYHIEFVGNRAFDAGIDNNTLWALMQYGQDILAAEFKLQESIS